MPRPKLLARLVPLLVLVLSVLALPHVPGTFAAENWKISNFAAAYRINADGSFDVDESILVDFGSEPHHGIFRDIPVEYKYDATHNRVIGVKLKAVDDGTKPIPYTTSKKGADLEIKIGDPNKTVTGQQQYYVRYHVTGGLNAQEDDDELFWNLGAAQFPVPLAKASVMVVAPSITRAVCFQGPTGSREPCVATPTDRTSYLFTASRQLGLGDELTFVVGLTHGTVAVAAPELVRIKSPGEQVVDFLGLKPLPILAALLVGLGALGLVVRQWWQAGRDRWYGGVSYLSGDTTDRPKPLFAHESVVVEYQPPELKGGRRLRPAEIGLLMDERADTLDVSATIVDLAVRGYLRVVELDKKGLFGKTDYRFERLKPADDTLLGYEAKLLNSLFESGETVEMSDLKNKFYDDLAAVKSALYDQGVREDKLFSSNPESTRTLYFGVGAVIIAIGVGAIFGLGSVAGAGIIGLPIILAGLLMLAFAHAMARRTGSGRELLRRSRGFREYMVTAETDRQRFNEQQHLFDDYLPYAIVFGCTEKWARAFEGLGGGAPSQHSWYVGQGPFLPLVFASNLNSFSSSISTAIASTPSSSGSSGFGGGGFSGGGMGGGGGGAW